MNWAAFHIANGKELRRAIQNGRILKAERAWDKEVMNGQDRLPVGDKIASHVDYLTGADQEIPDLLVRNIFPGKV